LLSSRDRRGFSVEWWDETRISELSIMTLLQVQPILDTWQAVSWEEFVLLADNAQSDKLKCYYYDGKMRFEPMSTGSDHANDHALIILRCPFLRRFKVSQ
jgi:hypothetical protein